MIVVVDKSLSVFVNNIVVVRYIDTTFTNTYISSSDMHLFRRLSSNVQLWYYIAITNAHLPLCNFAPFLDSTNLLHISKLHESHTRDFFNHKNLVIISSTLLSFIRLLLPTKIKIIVSL